MIQANTAENILEDKDIQQKIQATWTLVDDAVRRLVKDKPIADEVYLNHHILLHAIESYYCDLYRLSLFRGIDADSHKQAAFIAKWIVRLRPIQIHSRTSNPSKDTLLINEILAVYMILVILIRQIGIIPQIIASDKNYIHHLIYLLHFHSCESPEQLASELYQFDQNIRKI